MAVTVVYQAQDLANRITNTEPIFGVNSQQEGHLPAATYAYNISRQPTWDIARNKNASGVYNNFRILNLFDPLLGFDLTRTGVQYDAALSFTPVGSYIDLPIDSFNFPVGVTSFKIRVYKGRSQLLTGAFSEMRTPSNTGYIPYSNEITVTEDATRYQIYLNSLATSDLITNQGKLNLFILGEFDYNNIDPTTSYSLSYNGVGSDIQLITFD